MLQKEKFDENYYNEENNEEILDLKNNEILVRNKKVIFPEILYNNILGINKLIEHNFDSVFFIDGMEGSGKSELGKQCGLILDNNFNEDSIVFTPEQFKEWVLDKKRKKGDVCLWDEFIFGGNSVEALTQMQNTLMKMFVTMRSKGLIVILVAPSIFLVRKYFAIFRCRFLLHCYTKGINRGYMKFYNYSQKQLLYNYGYKTWMYHPKVKPSFCGKFINWSREFLLEEKIEKKKQEAIKTLEEKEEKEEIKLTKKQMEYICEIPISSYFGPKSTEYETLRVLQNKIKEFRGFKNPKTQNSSNIIEHD